MGDEGTSIATEQRRGELRPVSGEKNASVLVLCTSRAYFWTDSSLSLEKNGKKKRTKLLLFDLKPEETFIVMCDHYVTLYVTLLHDKTTRLAFILEKSCNVGVT